MMKIRRRFCRGERGQSLIETALILPLLLSIACNAINVAYFWYMALTLTSIPRIGAQYASQGGQAITSSTAPNSTVIKNLIYENLQNTIRATDVNASVRVCTPVSGVDSATNITNCDSFGPTPPTAFPANTADPEPTYFKLIRVDVAYTVTPLIPGTIFRVVLPANMTFYRHATMRNLY